MCEITPAFKLAS